MDEVSKFKSVTWKREIPRAETRDLVHMYREVGIYDESTRCGNTQAVVNTSKCGVFVMKCGVFVLQCGVVVLKCQVFAVHVHTVHQQ